MSLPWLLNPADANWIESANSVMDDNRLLTLPSNERIRLLPHMKVSGCGRGAWGMGGGRSHNSSCWQANV